MWEDISATFHQKAQGNFNIANLALSKDSEDKKKTAVYFVTKDLSIKEYSYDYFDRESNQLANLLVEKGIQKGDRVMLFLPRIPEAYSAFFAILKVGAIAVPVFSAFQDQALKDRIQGSSSTIIITHESLLGRIESIASEIPSVTHVIVIGMPPLSSSLNVISFADIKSQKNTFTISQTKPEDSAFMLYTSGSTGKPKGILHAHRALIQQYATARDVLDLKDTDVYWCTADQGWITGVSYSFIAPFVCTVPTVFFEGGFSAQSWYSIVEKLKVSVMYTAPTALRMLMASSLDVSNFDLSSLRLIASVGEPLNPEVVSWGQETLGLTILDTWYQTELGSITISNIPGLPVRPGSMGKALKGVEAIIIDDNGKMLPKNIAGNLALKPTMPSFMKDVWQNPEKYQSYFNNGWYITGDTAEIDDEGYVWFHGRADDLINTSGERVGPFEVESALISHPAVAEAGVIGKPDPLRGEIIKAFVVLKEGQKTSADLELELIAHVKKHLAGHAYPREIEFIDSLPKTRSGKIMRRVLKARETGQDVGDTSSMEKQGE